MSRVKVCCEDPARLAGLGHAHVLLSLARQAKCTVTSQHRCSWSASWLVMTDTCQLIRSSGYSLLSRNVSQEYNIQ